MAKKDNSKIEDPKERATAQTTPAKHDGPKILVMYDADRIYTVSTHEEIGKVKNTGQVRYRNHQLILFPGLNFVAASLYKLQEGNVRFRSRQEQGEIYIVEGFHKTRPMKLGTMIKKTAHVPTLRTLRDEEEREDVVDMLQNHIDECVQTKGAGVRSRAAQRAHNRNK